MKKWIKGISVALVLSWGVVPPLSTSAATTLQKSVVPAAPIVKTVSDQSKNVTGSAKPGSTIAVTIGTNKFSAKADSHGNFQVSIPQQKAGTKLLVTVTDAAGNVSAGATLTVLDKTAPAITLVKTVSDQSKSVVGSAEPASTVTLTIATKKYLSKADLHGNFQISIPLQKAGTKLLVTATDAAGNVSASASLTVLDKTAPPIALVNTVSDQSKSVIGTAEPGSTVTITIATKKYSAKADSHGIFQVSIPLQKAGTKLHVTAIDAAGNVSAVESLSVVDKTAPAIPLVKTVSDQSKSVIGSAEPGSTVTVTIATKKYSAKTDPHGNFQVTIPQQKAGTKLLVIATDAAGNVSPVASITVLVSPSTLQASGITVSQQTLQNGITYPKISMLTSKTIEAQINNVFYNYALQVQKNNTEAKQQEAQDKLMPWYFGGDYYYNLSYMIRYNRDNIISVELDNSMYDGGVHGSEWIDGYSFDLLTGKGLTLSNVIQNSTQLQKVNQYIRNQMIQENAVNPDYPRWVEDFNSVDLQNDQFYYTDGGVVIVFGEYEYGPYSDGILSYKVPYSAFK